MTFYLTFGQKNIALKGGWIEVEAENYNKAHDLVKSIFGDHWGNLYTEENFGQVSRLHFPDGKIGRTIK